MEKSFYSIQFVFRLFNAENFNRTLSPKLLQKDEKDGVVIFELADNICAVKNAV